MNRRAIIAALAGTLAWPPLARAQPTSKRPIVGFLGAATEEGWKPWIAAFIQRMNELGWVDGRTLTIEYRWAEGRSTRYAEIAAELVELRVDAIVTAGAPAPPPPPPPPTQPTPPSPAPPPHPP